MTNHLDDPWIHPRLDDELFDLYYRLGSIRKFAKNEYVMRFDEPVKYTFLIVEGSCQYEYTSVSGIVRSLGTLYARSSFCEFPQIINTVCELDIKTREDTEISLISYLRLADILHSSPELSKKHLKYMCEKKNHMLDIYHRLVESNTFCRFLAYLRSIVSYKKLVVDNNGDYIMTLKDTHETIGEIIGCNRVTISRMIGYFLENNYISFPQKNRIKFNIKLLDENYMNEKFAKISWKDVAVKK